MTWLEGVGIWGRLRRIPCSSTIGLERQGGGGTWLVKPVPLPCSTAAVVASLKGLGERGLRKSGSLFWIGFNEVDDKYRNAPVMPGNRYIWI